MSLGEARRVWDEQKRVRDDLARGDPRAEFAMQRAVQVEAAADAKLARYDVERLCVDYLSEHVDRQRMRSKEPRRLLTREVIPLIDTKVASQLVRGEVHGLVRAIVGRGAERIAQMVLGELIAGGFAGPHRGMGGTGTPVGYGAAKPEALMYWVRPCS